VVAKGHYKQQTGAVVECAIKTLRVCLLGCHRFRHTEQPGSSEEDKESLLEEAKLVCQFQDANVVEFFGQVCD
jgi:hypothetical protein